MIPIFFSLSVAWFANWNYLGLGVNFGGFKVNPHVAWNELLQCSLLEFVKLVGQRQYGLKIVGNGQFFNVGHSFCGIVVHVDDVVESVVVFKALYVEVAVNFVMLTHQSSAILIEGINHTGVVLRVAQDCRILTELGVEECRKQAAIWYTVDAVVFRQVPVNVLHRMTEPLLETGQSLGRVKDFSVGFLTVDKVTPSNFDYAAFLTLFYYLLHLRIFAIQQFFQVKSDVLVSIVEVAKCFILNINRLEHRSTCIYELALDC